MLVVNFVLKIYNNWSKALMLSVVKRSVFYEWYFTRSVLIVIHEEF